MCEPENSHGSGKAYSEPTSKGQFNCKGKELTVSPSLRAELSQNKRSQTGLGSKKTNKTKRSSVGWGPQLIAFGR